jgi:hypothetical protein
MGLFLFYFEVLGFELRAHTLSHSTSPFSVMLIFQDRVSLFARAGFKL